jgi:hypothetical protein
MIRRKWYLRIWNQPESQSPTVFTYPNHFPVFLSGDYLINIVSPEEGVINDRQFSTPLADGRVLQVTLLNGTEFTTAIGDYDPFQSIHDQPMSGFTLFFPDTAMGSRDETGQSRLHSWMTSDDAFKNRDSSWFGIEFVDSSVNGDDIDYSSSETGGFTFTFTAEQLARNRKNVFIDTTHYIPESLRTYSDDPDAPYLRNDGVDPVAAYEFTTQPGEFHTYWEQDGTQMQSGPYYSPGAYVFTVTRSDDGGLIIEAIGTLPPGTNVGGYYTNGTIVGNSWNSLQFMKFSDLQENTGAFTSPRGANGQPLPLGYATVNASGAVDAYEIVPVQGPQPQRYVTEGYDINGTQYVNTNDQTPTRFVVTYGVTLDKVEGTAMTSGATIPIYAVDAQQGLAITSVTGSDGQTHYVVLDMHKANLTFDSENTDSRILNVVSTLSTPAPVIQNGVSRPTDTTQVFSVPETGLSDVAIVGNMTGNAVSAMQEFKMTHDDVALQGLLTEFDAQIDPNLSIPEQIVTILNTQLEYSTGTNSQFNVPGKLANIFQSAVNDEPSLGQVITTRETVCLEYASVAQVWLSMHGIESQIVTTNTDQAIAKGGHAFVLLDDGTVVDPTYGVIMPLADYQANYGGAGVDDPEHYGYVQLVRPIGNP